jgi:hypothetical protein
MAGGIERKEKGKISMEETNHLGINLFGRCTCTHYPKNIFPNVYKF